jgi:hypothetical protein
VVSGYPSEKDQDGFPINNVGNDEEGVKSTEDQRFGLSPNLLTFHFSRLMTQKSGRDLSKVPAECQESDETDDLFTLRGKDIVRKNIVINTLKYMWLRGL